MSEERVAAHTIGNHVELKRASRFSSLHAVGNESCIFSLLCWVVWALLLYLISSPVGVWISADKLLLRRATVTVAFLGNSRPFTGNVKTLFALLSSLISSAELLTPPLFYQVSFLFLAFWPSEETCLGLILKVVSGRAANRVGCFGLWAERRGRLCHKLRCVLAAEFWSRWPRETFVLQTDRDSKLNICLSNGNGCRGHFSAISDWLRETGVWGKAKGS